MTPRQRDLLDYLRRYIPEHGGVSPTFDEMTAAIGLSSKSGIARLLEGLEGQGLIARRRGKTRDITVTVPDRYPPNAALAAATDEAILAEASRRGLLRGAA